MADMGNNGDRQTAAQVRRREDSGGGASLKSIVRNMYSLEPRRAAPRVVGKSLVDTPRQGPLAPTRCSRGARLPTAAESPISVGKMQGLYLR